MDDSKETVSSRHDRPDAHINSQSLWQHAQGLHRSKSDGVPVLKSEVDTNPYLNQEAVCNWYLLANKELFSPREESHWVHKPHLRTGPLPSSRWPTQNELHSILGVFYIIMLWAFFTFSVLCVCIVASKFVGFGVYVCMCAFVSFKFYLPFFSLREKEGSQVVVAHAFNPSIQWAEAGGSPWVGEQHGLQELVPGQPVLLHRETLYQKTKRKRGREGARERKKRERERERERAWN